MAERHLRTMMARGLCTRWRLWWRMDADVVVEKKKGIWRSWMGRWEYGLPLRRERICRGGRVGLLEVLWALLEVRVCLRAVAAVVAVAVGLLSLDGNALDSWS